MQNDLLSMLESLLSITECHIYNMDNERRKEWRRISAAVADIRETKVVQVPDDDYSLRLWYTQNPSPKE